MASDRSKEQDDENDLKHQLRALSQLLEKAGIPSGMDESETPARQLASLQGAIETALESRPAPAPSLDSSRDVVHAERQRFLDMLDSLPAIIALLRPDHRVVWANRAYREALGDNVGKPCYASRFGRDKPCAECQAFVPLKTGQPHSWEWTLPNGRTFDIHNFPFTDVDGSPLILEVDIDVTERRQAEVMMLDLNDTLEQRVAERTAALQASEERLRQEQERLALAQQIGQIGSFEYNLRDGTSFWPPELEALHGLPPGSYDGSVDAWRELVHPDDRAQAEASFAQALQSHRLDGEWRVVWPDGTVRWLTARGRMLLDAEGRPERLVGVNMDITEEKLAAQKLERQRELLQRVFNSIPVLLVTWEPHLQRFTLNRHAEDVLGWTTADANEGDFMNKVYPDDAYRAEVSAFMHSLNPDWREWQSTAKDGHTVPIEWANVHLKDDTAVGIGVDLRRRKQDKDALRQSEARFALLAETAGTLLVAPDPQAMVEELCRKVMLHLDCDVFVNFMADEAAGRLRLNACAGIPEEEIPQIEWLDYGVAVCGCVARDRQRVIAEDILHQPDARTDLVKSYGVQAYCCHPLMAGERLIGTLSFGATRRARFSDEDVELMQAVSHQVSVAMERIQREEALRASEARFRQLADAMPQLVWTAEPDGRVDYYNERRSEYAGLANKEDGSYEWAPVLHPDDVDDTVRAWGHALKTGTIYQIEHRVRRTDGSFRWHISRGLPHCDQEGRLIKWYGTATDVHDLKLTQENLRRRTEELETIMEIAPAAIWVAQDAQCSHIVGNSMANTFYQARGGENVSANASAARRFFHHDRELFPDELPMQRAAATNSPVINEDMEVLLPDGSIISMLGSAVPLLDEENRVRGCVGAFVDVTPLKRTQQELIRLNETLEQRVAERTAELQATNRELEAFSYSVSHDLRAPLRTIDGFTRILLERHAAALNDEGRDYLGRVRNGAVRMTQLIDDLLRLSRVNRSELRLQPVDLSQMAASIAQKLQQREPGRDVEFAIQPDLSVQADAGLLRILLDNMLGNAFKFTGGKEHARIEVGTTEENGHRVYYVSDNGIGFDEAYAGKLFAPFQRLHGNDEFAGSGIGLAIVQRIVNRHGGQIWGHGTPGQGAAFFFTLGE